MAITERCHELDRLRRIITAQLQFNVVKNSDSFIEGLGHIKGVSDDLRGIKEVCTDSKNAVEVLQNQIILKIARVLALERQRKRLALAKCLIG